MRAYILAFFFIISCSISHPEKPSEIVVMQRIWDSKDPSLAYALLPRLKKIEEDKKYYVLGISKENSILRLSITYDKQTNKAVSASLWLFENSEGTVDYIKTQIQTSDWKTFEHPIKNHPLRTEISEYSDNKGVSFLYDKLDSRKEVRKIYWGVDPKKINW
jgi:hypothetical protein